MRRFNFQPKHLFLLALFQLLAGPLVLLQVTWFCTLTVREVPQQGLAKAVSKAWHDEKFQALLTASLQNGDESAHAGDSSKPAPKGKLEKTKCPCVAWEMTVIPSCHVARAETAWTSDRPWTPRQAHGPPGPPPRAA